jgi:hypothetical protein
MALLETTEKLLERAKAANLTPRDVVAASGGSVEIEWLYKFWQGKAKNPTVRRVQNLHDTLKKISKSN